MKLPTKIGQLIESKSAKFVLLRLPDDVSLAEDLEGVGIDMSDLKLTSGNTISAIPDRQTNPDRGSACTLLPDGKGRLKCGPAFVAHIQVIKGNSIVSTLESKTVKIKKEIGTKSSKKRKSE